MVAALLLATLLGGTLEGAWGLGSVLQLGPYFLIAGTVAVLGWGFHRRFERRQGLEARSDGGPLMDGPISITEGMTHAEMRFRLATGEGIHGSITETRGRIFDLSVRSRRSVRGTGEGEVAPIIFHFRGTASSIGVPPASTPDVYEFRFERVGDGRDREIRAYLIRSGPPRGPTES